MQNAQSKKLASFLFCFYFLFQVPLPRLGLKTLSMSLFFSLELVWFMLPWDTYHVCYFSKCAWFNVIWTIFYLCLFWSNISKRVGLAPYHAW
jgi:hypothetical protein